MKESPGLQSDAGLLWHILATLAAWFVITVSLAAAGKKYNHNPSRWVMLFFGAMFVSEGLAIVTRSAYPNLVAIITFAVLGRVLIWRWGKDFEKKMQG